jgi:lysophospholipid acyltransferase (LPLAT)-like uncharacterized protein
MLKAPAVQAILAYLLGLYLSFALRTTRWTFDGFAYAEPHLVGRPVVAAFWHERLPLLPAFFLEAQRRRRVLGHGPGRMTVLVSRHRDGRFIGAVVRRFGLKVVLGSSSRGGAAGVRLLLGMVAAGEHVGITPDGPRGPRRVAAPGVAQVAALAGVPVLPCAAQTSRRWVLKTWDRMVIPLPFGRGVVVVGAPIAVPVEGWEAKVAPIAAAITAAADRADALCPG